MFQFNDVQKGTENQIGQQIRQLRLEMGLTQGQFAVRLGVSFPTVNRWENQKAKPSPLALQKLQKLLLIFKKENQFKHRNQPISDSCIGVNKMMLSHISIKIICFLVALPTLLYGKIIETDSIMHIVNYVQEDTLVIADLDNTLIESQNQLGSSQWGDHLGTLFTKPGKSLEEVDFLVAEMWCKVQPLIKIHCVDPQTPQIINQIHEQGIVFMGLTARRPSEVHYTHKQLVSAQINLGNIIEEGFLEDTLDSRRGIIYHQGVIYCTPMNKKSYGLKLFLDKSMLCPKRIIFIDDKLSHVEDVAQLVENLGIDYLGIRFSRADEKVKSFNSKIAKIQFDYLPQIISDDEAMLILKSQLKD